MRIDLIHYKKASHISEEKFIALTTRVREQWMQHQPGFIEWKQFKNSNGGYTDLVTWASAEAAAAAEKAMADFPEAKAWEACYVEVSFYNLEPLNQ